MEVRNLTFRSAMDRYHVALSSAKTLHTWKKDFHLTMAVSFQLMGASVVAYFNLTPIWLLVPLVIGFGFLAMWTKFVLKLRQIEALRESVNSIASVDTLEAMTQIVKAKYLNAGESTNR